MDRNSPLVQAYLYHRQQSQGRWQAVRDLRVAREDVAAGKRRYAKDAGEFRYYVGNWDKAAYHATEWPEGWRLLGRADEVKSDDGRNPVYHRGWYLGDDYHDTCAGYVLMLPARNGKPQYVPGTQCSNSDGVTLYPLDRYDSALDCVRAADRYAERLAEDERDYRAAWQAGSQAAQLSADAIAARKEALAALADIRATRKHVAAYGQSFLKPASTAFNADEAVARICKIARENVARLRRRMIEARAERDELVSEWNGNKVFADTYAEGV